MGTHYVANQQAIEGVQRRVTKLISSISHCPYPERLKILNLPSLNYRQLRGDMIFLYQITHHNSDSSLIDLFQPALTSSILEATTLNISNLDVKHATDATSFHTGPLITGTIYPYILSMQIQSTLSKIS